MDLTGIVKTLTEEEFTTGKNVIAGTSEKVSGKIYLYRGCNIVYIDCEYIPAINKVVDELIVNATDHFVNCVQKKTIQHRAKSAEQPRFVDILAVTIAQDSGQITISNTGYGIPIIQMDDYDGLYLPEVLFSKQRTGTNMDSDVTRITGGTNGIGATIVAAFSREMTIEVRDRFNHYIQHVTKAERTENRRKVTYSKFEQPTISPNTTNSQFTKIIFTIDWKNTKYKTFRGNAPLIIDYILKRLIQASMYTNHIASIVSVPRMKSVGKIVASAGDVGKFIDYNCDITDTDKITQMFGFFKCFCIKLQRKKPSGEILADTISVVIGINNRDNLGYREMSIVNGVEVTRNPFMGIIRKYLLNSVKNLCKQKNIQFGTKSPKLYFSLLSVMCLPNPQWVGQTKEEITVNKEVIDAFDIISSCNAVKEQISEVIYEMILCNNINSTVTRVAKTAIDKKTYTKCNNLDEKHKRINNDPNYLMLCEGTSAASLIKGVADRNRIINHNNTGLLTTSGVPINVYHQIGIVSNEDMKHIKLEFGETPKKKMIASKKVEDNKFYQQWCLASGLNSEVLTYEQLAKRLNYRTFICATDSDYDGWNIAGLFIVLFSKYNGLLENGHLRILHLPVIRIIPGDLDTIVAKEKKRTGSNILSEQFVRSISYREYFSIREYEEDVKINPVPSGHTVKFYKGLASTEDFFKDVIAIDIRKYIYTIVADEKYEESIRHYYGKFDVVSGPEGNIVLKMSDKRKEILRKGVSEMTQEERDFFKSKKITVSTFLRHYVGQYYLDNIKRKLLGLMDGLNEVMRKIMYILTGSHMGNKFAKVSEIAGKISAESSYHHGQASLEGAIINFGQDFYGARLYPPFVTSGQWGNIQDGGKSPGSAGSARYIHAKSDDRFIELLFRKEDNIILEHQESEGETIEPKFFLPILPLVIMENYGTAAHGWKCEVWGRSLNLVVVSVIKMINAIDGGTVYDPRSTVLEVDPRNGATFYYCEEIDEDGETRRKNMFYSKGSYEVKGDVIHVTSLPICVWTDDFVNRINSKIAIEETEDGIHKGELEGIVREAISDNSEVVDISIHMYPGWKAKLDKITKREIGDDIDSIEQVFGLKVRIADNLNFLDTDGSVASYETYEDVIVDWFYKRLEFYRKRITRERILIELELLITINKLKYLRLFDVERLYGISEEEFNRKLADGGLCRLRDVRFNDFRCNKVPNDKIIAFSTMEISEEDSILFAELVKNKLTTHKLSYQYLKSIPTGRISNKGIAELEAKKQTLEAKLLALQGNVETKIWKAEISEFMRYFKSK